MFTKIERIGYYDILLYKNEFWLKVFYHDHSAKVCFTSEAEAKHCNSTYKYSILDEIGPRMKTNKRYEFLMDFPHDNVYVQWVQNKNPLIEVNGNINADGFIKGDNNLPPGSQEFHGLTQSIHGEKGKERGYHIY